MTGCEHCNGYELVDSDGDGVYDAPCPVCRSNVQRCPVHGRTVRNGHCPGCGKEAALAEDLIVCSSRVGGHPLAGAVA